MLQWWSDGFVSSGASRDGDVDLIRNNGKVARTVIITHKGDGGTAVSNGGRWDLKILSKAEKQ